MFCASLISNRKSSLPIIKMHKKTPYGVFLNGSSGGTVLLVRDKRRYVPKLHQFRHFCLCSLALEPNTKLCFVRFSSHKKLLKQKNRHKACFYLINSSGGTATA